MRILRLGARVSTKVNGHYVIGTVVRRWPGKDEDGHRYDIVIERGCYREGREARDCVVYQTRPDAANWEVLR